MNLYKIISVSLALLMFITSVSFSMDMHFCQGELKSINFFGEAESCHDMAKMKSCPHHQNMKSEPSKKDCCDNKTIEVELEQDRILQIDNQLTSNFSLELFLIGYVEVFLNEISTSSQKIKTNHYFAPLIPRDIYVLLETFLL